MANTDKDLVVMDFIRDYLANKWISKLIEQMRLRKNLTYWVNGNTEHFSDTGLLRLVFSCDKKDVADALKIVSDEIEKLNSSVENIDIYKKSFSSSLQRRFIDLYEYIWWYGWQASVSRKESLLNIEAYSKLIVEITEEDIKQVASKYLIEENKSVSFIGSVDISKDL